MKSLELRHVNCKQVWQHGKLNDKTVFLLIVVFHESLDSLNGYIQGFAAATFGRMGGGIHPDMTSVIEGECLKI